MSGTRALARLSGVLLGVEVQSMNNLVLSCACVPCTDLSARHTPQVGIYSSPLSTEKPRPKYIDISRWLLQIGYSAGPTLSGDQPLHQASALSPWNVDIGRRELNENLTQRQEPVFSSANFQADCVVDNDA